MRIDAEQLELELEDRQSGKPGAADGSSKPSVDAADLATAIKVRLILGLTLLSSVLTQMSGHHLLASPCFLLQHQSAVPDTSFKP